MHATAKLDHEAGKVHCYTKARHCSIARAWSYTCPSLESMYIHTFIRHKLSSNFNREKQLAPPINEVIVLRKLASTVIKQTVVHSISKSKKLLPMLCGNPEELVSL